MKAKHHFLSSALLGGTLYLATGSPSAFLGSMIGGFFIDADHIIDQVWSIRAGSPDTRNSSPIGESKSGFRSWYSRFFRRRKLIRLPLVFHSYELMVGLGLLTFFWRSPFLYGIFSGYLLHLALDLWRHHHEFRSPFFYLLVYRMIHKFRRDQLIKPDYL